MRTRISAKKIGSGIGEVEREESKENFCELQDNSFVVPVAFCWGMMCMV